MIRYGENVEDISFFPFKNMWMEGQALFLALYTLVTLYLNFKLRQLQMRFEEIGES